MEEALPNGKANPIEPKAQAVPVKNRVAGTVLTIYFITFSNASKRNQKSVQWTDFPA